MKFVQGQVHTLARKRFGMAAAAREARCEELRRIPAHWAEAAMNGRGLVRIKRCSKIPEPRSPEAQWGEATANCGTSYDAWRPRDCPWTCSTRWTQLRCWRRTRLSSTRNSSNTSGRFRRRRRTGVGLRRMAHRTPRVPVSRPPVRRRWRRMATLRPCGAGGGGAHRGGVPARAPGHLPSAHVFGPLGRRPPGDLHDTEEQVLGIRGACVPPPRTLMLAAYCVVGQVPS